MSRWNWISKTFIGNCLWRIKRETPEVGRNSLKTVTQHWHLGRTEERKDCIARAAKQGTVLKKVLARPMESPQTKPNLALNKSSIGLEWLGSCMAAVFSHWAGAAWGKDALISAPVKPRVYTGDYQPGQLFQQVLQRHTSMAATLREG